MADLRRLLDDGKPIFGTDGVRGVASSELTAELALAIGRRRRRYLRGGPVVVGRDTRRSGEMLSAALQAGFHSAGIDTVDVGVLPWGGISYLTATTGGHDGRGRLRLAQPGRGQRDQAAGGPMAPSSATRSSERSRIGLRSHGQPGPPSGPAIGTRFSRRGCRSSPMSTTSWRLPIRLSGLQIALDCANGAAYQGGAAALRPAQGRRARSSPTRPTAPTSTMAVGATHPEFLAAHGARRIGLAFDGDADRLIAIDEDGVWPTAT